MTLEQWNNIPAYYECEEALPGVPYFIYREYVKAQARYCCLINELGEDNQCVPVWYGVRVK